MGRGAWDSRGSVQTHGVEDVKGGTGGTGWEAQGLDVVGGKQEETSLAADLTKDIGHDLSLG